MKTREDTRKPSIKEVLRKDPSIQKFDEVSDGQALTGFANVNVHQNYLESLLKRRLLGPVPGFLI